jgi:hypothetical protein
MGLKSIALTTRPRMLVCARSAAFKHRNAVLETGEKEKKKKRTTKKKWYVLDLCVSSLRRGHANLLCIVPILSYETGVTPLENHSWIFFFSIHGDRIKIKKTKKKSPRERLELSTLWLTATRAANCAIRELTRQTRTGWVEMPECIQKKKTEG